MKVHLDLLADQINANRVLLDTETYQHNKEYCFELDQATLKSKQTQLSFTELEPDKHYEIVLRLEY